MNIYERTSRFFVANPKKIFFLFVIITIGLTLSYLFIPYRGDASTSPKDPIIDLDIKISNEFSDEVHFALFILEGKNSDDILSKDNLLKVFNATEKLRAEDASKNLSPERIIDSEHLYKYIDSDTGVKVNGIFTIADVVNNVLIINPKYNKTLKDASNNEVKEIISEVFKGDGFKDIKRTW